MLYMFPGKFSIVRHLLTDEKTHSFIYLFSKYTVPTMCQANARLWENNDEEKADVGPVPKELTRPCKARQQSNNHINKCNISYFEFCNEELSVPT